MEAMMPVIEYALDPAALHCIQVHVPTEQTVYTVMLDRSVLGFLETPDEQRIGKYFVLPDRSTLYVRIEGRRPQVFRNSYLLTPLTGMDTMFSASRGAPARKSSGNLLERIKKVAGKI